MMTPGAPVPARYTFLVFFFLSNILISGCSATPEPDNGSEIQAADSTAEEQTMATLAPAIDEPEPLPIPDPASLIGYGAVALEGLLGLPSFTRQDPPAELWQYRNDACILDLFLYETPAGSHSVEYLEFRETGTTNEAAENCLRVIIENKLATAPSA